MKTATTILLLCLVLGCDAQEPDVDCYSVDTVLAMQESYQDIIDSLNNQIRVNDSIRYVGKQVDADTFNFLIKGLTDDLEIQLVKTGEDDSDKLFFANYTNGSIQFTIP